MSENQANPGGEGRTEPFAPPAAPVAAPYPQSAPEVAPDAQSAPDAQAAPAPAAPAPPPSAEPTSAQPVTAPLPASVQPASAQPASVQPASAQPVTGPLPAAPAYGPPAPGSPTYPPATAGLPPTAGPAPTSGPAYPPVTPPDPTRVPSAPAAAYPYATDPYAAPTAPPAGAYPWPAPAPQPAPGPKLSAPVRQRLVAGAAALAIALTGGAIGGAIGYGLRSEGNPLQVPATSGNGNAAPVVDRSSLASIAAALQPAIVDITTNASEGSGVVISADGHIVTNNHVLAGARGDSVRVTFNSGRQIPAQIVGTDPQTDIAVIKVDAEGLAFATWGDSDSVQVGDTVLAIGSPLGLQGSVTAGIVSALNRTITVREGQRSQFDTGNTTVIGGAIQTDAPINSGNSGGALVNMRGEVIGINTAIATAGLNGNIGVGFAISSNRAKAVSDALIAGDEVSHPFIGVQIADHDSGGALISSVVEGSPAAQAGLAEGDVITKVGERPIRGAEDLIGAIQSSTVGEQLTLTVRRDGSEQTITVTVGEQ